MYSNNIFKTFSNAFRIILCSSFWFFFRPKLYVQCLQLNIRQTYNSKYYDVQHYRTIINVFTGISKLFETYYYIIIIFPMSL